MKRYLFSVLFISSICLAAGRPRWISEKPVGYTNDYFVGFSEAKSLEEAKTLSREVASSQIRAQRSGIVLSKQNFVEQYTEQQRGIYLVWTLMNYPKPYEAQTSPPTRLDPVWRSVIAPSWGQFYKGESSKGYVIAVSEAVLIPAGIIFNNLKITNVSDAKNSRTQVLRDYYNDQANTYSNLSLGCFIAAGAVYIYNVVDAIVSDGEKVYVYLPDVRIHTTPAGGNFGLTSISIKIPF